MENQELYILINDWLDKMQGKKWEIKPDDVEELVEQINEEER